MKLRIRFTKTGLIKFVGHLDFMRTFQKIVARSGISPIYSAGFNPHMEMSFASPLGVGAESLGDYVDLEAGYRVPEGVSIVEKQRLDLMGYVNEEFPDVPSERFLLDTLNEASVEGVKFLGVRRITEDGKASRAMAVVRNAAYEIRLSGFSPDKREQIEQVWLSLSDETEINILKKTKKSEKLVNIRPLIHSAGIGRSSYRTVLTPDEDENDLILNLVCASGSTENLKPETLLDVFFEKLNFAEEPHADILRIDLMTEDLRSLGELGVKL